MILECLFNKIENVDAVYSEYIKQYIHQTEVALEIGKEYVVYGIVFRSNVPWFYVCEEESDDYPRLHFSGFFNLIDPKVSSVWEVNYSTKANNITHILPGEWNADPSFYENLVEGNEAEKEIFQRLKSFIDTEARSRKLL